MIKEDTIAAIATAPGEGGIGIVRISGDKALDIFIKIMSTVSLVAVAVFAEYNLADIIAKFFS